MDIHEFIEKEKRGSFNAAFKTFRSTVGFPQIVSELCHEPCKEPCPIGEDGSSINLNLLEKACLDYASNKEPRDYNLPKKKGKIAIIGAGISGMGCALRLATKKYDVSVFEKTDRIGGELWDIMDSEIFLSDIQMQFKHEEYELNLNTEVTSVAQLKEVAGDVPFDVVYVATGKGGASFDLPMDRAECCYEEDGIAVFGGGGLLGKAPVYALADGLDMSTTIDSYFKTGLLNYTKPYKETSMILDDSRRASTEAVPPSKEGRYTEEEAIGEANRCIECRCDACRIYCDLTEYVKKWPLRLRDEIQATTLPGSSEVKATPAKRLISMCTQCGLCKETCPEDIDLGGLILAARKSMHRQDKMAWVFNEFWLRDMDFSNGREASIVKSPPNEDECKYAFFPGCQLGASDPELVSKSYERLLDIEPATGIMLMCCGIPADWAGNEERIDSELSRINSAWESLGKPTLVLACPTCSNYFKKQLPHIPTVFLYDMMVEKGTILPDKKGKSYSVFDPCSTSEGSSVRESVRKLSSSCGCMLTPLKRQEKYTACCSYGGQGSVADPKFASFVRKKRIEEGDDPYITYCINCRDAFLGEGKEAVHILDLMFDTDPALVTITKRWENRTILKEALLKKHWNEEMKTEKTEQKINLIISDELKEKLSKNKLLDEDAADAVEFCERTKRTVLNEETGTLSGYTLIGHMTLWVEYKELPERDGKPTYELVNAFSHRMKIELEAIWNGKKSEIDVH